MRRKYAPVVIAAVLTAGATAIWERSLRKSDCLWSLETQTEWHGIWMHRGGLYYSVNDSAAEPIPLLCPERTLCFQSAGARWGDHPIMRPHSEFAGFRAGSGAIPVSYWFVGIPLWLPVGVAATLCVLFWRRSRDPRFAPGHCPSCGYDLRATPAKCSECGAMGPSPNAPATG